ncbi:unnamed protein product, partial [Urochloa humidicola]
PAGEIVLIGNLILLRAGLDIQHIELRKGVRVTRSFSRRGCAYRCHMVSFSPAATAWAA